MHSSIYSDFYPAMVMSGMGACTLIISLVIGCVWCGCGKKKGRKSTGQQDIEEEGTGSLGSVPGDFDTAKSGKECKLFTVEMSVNELKNLQPFEHGRIVKTNYITVENVPFINTDSSIPIERPANKSNESMRASVLDAKNSQGRLTSAKIGSIVQVDRCDHNSKRMVTV